MGDAAAEVCSVCATDDDVRPLAVVLERCGHTLCAEHFQRMWDAKTRSIDTCPECRAHRQRGALSVRAQAAVVTSDERAFVAWFRETRTRAFDDDSLAHSLREAGERLDATVARLERMRERTVGIESKKSMMTKVCEVALVVFVYAVAAKVWLIVQKCE